METIYRRIVSDYIVKKPTFLMNFTQIKSSRKI